MNYKEENDNELLFMVEEDNEESLKILIDKYKYLVDSIVKKYSNKLEISGLQHKDLHQEGLIGLIKAIRSFNKDKDVLFYTYAMVCIDSRIKSALRGANRQKNRFLNSSISLDMLFNDEYSLYDILIDESYNPSKKILEKESEEELISILKEKLTEFENSVLNLKLVGLSNNEISIILDKEKRSIENTISRIRVKYRDLKKVNAI